MSDELLTLLTHSASHPALKPIPWTAGYEPTVIDMADHPTSPMPRADVVVCTYTEAEGQALADVLSPGHPLTSWTHYEENFASYRSALTYRSPAKDAGCLGQYALMQIGNKRVLLFRSELHLATDAKSLPLRRLWDQIIRETDCNLWIDTGTAGGIGSDIVEGDCIVASNLRFDCTGFLKDEDYAHELFPCTYDTSQIDFSLAESLMAVNAAALHPEASRAPQVVRGDVVTVDAFLFDDSENSFGLRTYDPAARCEEMDCAVLGLVAEDLGAAMPKFTSVRSASDPQMPQMPGGVPAEKKAASQIYLRYGYETQVAALCAVWQIIAGL